MADDRLVLRFDPQTVDHLGAKMYSHLPNAIAELVANSYDADATKVEVRLEADGAISIADDGHGMSRLDVGEKYLHIGRNRRIATDTSLTESGERRVSGKKGLGKLALFGIGKQVRVTTTRANAHTATVIDLSYDDMMSAKGTYAPKESSVPSEVGQHGTIVRLGELKRVTPVSAPELAASLSKLFNYFGADFNVNVIARDGEKHNVTAALRLNSVNVQFSWKFPESWTADDTLGGERKIAGEIVSATSPLTQGLRGVTLYVNGRLANEPEFFGASESSYAFSYLTGYLNVDYIDELDSDVIATDRRAINWDSDETAALQAQLKRLLMRIGREWRVKRSQERKARTEKKMGPLQVWLDSIKTSEREPLTRLLEAVSSADAELTEQQQDYILNLVKEVAPPHAEYVWRHLHAEIQDATRSHYLANDYLVAIQEAIKRYVSRSKELSATTQSDATAIVAEAFGDKGKLRVFSRYMDLGGFDARTEVNVENGQKHVSMGVVAGFRNPLAHEEVARLSKVGAFTSIDCLDALSIVSHLMRRLDGAETR